MTVVSEHILNSDVEVDAPKIHELPEIAAVQVNPFDRSQPKKSHWLLTTAVTGITGFLVIGGTVLGTFGLGSEGHASAVTHIAKTKHLWQQRTALSKADRENLKFNFSGLVGKRQESEVIGEKAYKRVAVAFANPTPEPKTHEEATSGAKGGSPNLTSNVIDQDIIYKKETPKRSAVRAKTKSDSDAKSLIGLRGGKDNAQGSPSANIDDLASLTPGKSTILPKSYGLTPLEEFPQREMTISMTSGAKLKNLMVQRGLDAKYSAKLLATLETVYATRKIKRGQKLHLTYEKTKNNKGRDILKPVRLAMLPTPSREISVELDTDNQFYAHINGTRVSQPNATASKRAKARIRKSLYLAAKEQGIPENIIIKMMRVHAYEVDFQRQVRPGDSFEVFYGQDVSQKKRKKVGPDVVLYSALILSGKKKAYYRFTTPDDGITDYYDDKGKSATRFLTRTPIEGSRITSGYGMRRHPLLGYRKMHTGVDFVAPYGTPIKATGHGVIDRSGWVGGYGKHVRIQHRNGYATTYSHMSRIHRRMKKGVKVKQGDVIGYLGNSGQSTAAHLHYEVLVNKRFVNPMSLRLPTGRQLKGKMLTKFKRERGRIVKLMNSAPMAENVAGR